MSTAQKFKAGATVAVLIPIGFLLLFAVGEGATGWPHYLQLLIPLGALLVAWCWPRAGGWLFIALAVVLGLAYAVGAAPNLQMATIIIVEVVLFAPAALSGYLFLRAARA